MLSVATSFYLRMHYITLREHGVICSHINLLENALYYLEGTWCYLWQHTVLENTIYYLQGT